MIINQSGPAKHTRAVILNGDENVADFARFIFHQIAANEPERDYDLVFCTPVPGLDPRHENLPEIRVCTIDTAFLDIMPTNRNIPPANHIKIALPELFRQDYEQILYLDTDIFIRHGKMSELMDLAPRGVAVSAVLDGLQWQDRLAKQQLDAWEVLEIGACKYFNAGIQVFDTAAYCEQNILENVLEYTKQNHQHFYFTDQDAFNGYLKGNWAPLPLEWNWQASRLSMQLVREFDPHILHFVGQTKPYLANPLSFTRSYGRYYEEFFEQILQKPLKRKPRTKARDARHRPDLLRRINRFNPFFYTPIRNLLALPRHRARLRRVSRAIKNGTALWPPEALQRGEKDPCP